jgi:hypothetical protein
MWGLVSDLEEVMEHKTRHLSRTTVHLTTSGYITTPELWQKDGSH